MNILLELNKDLLWSSDWNGYEVGFPHINVVGCYRFLTPDCKEVNFYIDMENMQILDIWTDED